MRFAESSLRSPGPPVSCRSCRREFDALRGRSCLGSRGPLACRVAPAAGEFGELAVACARCGIRGHGNSRAAGVAALGVVAAAGGRQLGVLLAALRNKGLWQADRCHNPLFVDAGRVGIATTPKSMTPGRRGGGAAGLSPMRHRAGEKNGRPHSRGAYGVMPCQRRIASPPRFPHSPPFRGHAVDVGRTMSVVLCTDLRGA